MVFWSDENSAEVGTNFLSKNLGLFFLTLPFQRTKHSHLPGEANPIFHHQFQVRAWKVSGRVDLLVYDDWKRLACKHISLTKMFQNFHFDSTIFHIFVHHPLKKKHTLK